MVTLITVTPKDIAEGKPGEAHSCPIALAIQRAIPKAEDVEVDSDYISFCYELIAQAIYIDIPSRLMISDFIEQFDKYKPVRPFEFLLRYDDEVDYGDPTED